MNLALHTWPGDKPASILLKAIMAVTGLGMAMWLTLHMLGMLLVFAGPQVMNEYALKLRATGLLWPMRGVLLFALIAHVTCAIVTTRRGWVARGERYHRALHPRATTFAARSMRLGGFALLAYLAYHVPQQHGFAHPAYVAADVHHNLLSVLHQPLHAGVYVLATLFAALHLAHGLGSSLISLGIVARRRERLVRRALRAWVWLVTLGFTLVVVSPWLRLT